MRSDLAIEGGAPVRTSPMPTWPSPGPDEIEAVERVLRSGRINYWTGEETRTFEVEYAQEVGRRHGIAVANGTVALELALRAFGVGAGDEVVVPSRTFVATASAVVAVGAAPVFADIDAESGNMTADTVREVLSSSTRAVIPVHVGGWPVEMADIGELARERDLLVIEDCAQAHGAEYRGASVGSFGHASAFSFCQDKILPVGEGGLLLLDDDEAYERAWAYKDHGKSLSKLRSVSSAPGGATFQWLVDSFGTNWRLGEMEGALGRVGLRRLPEWVQARRGNAMRLADGISDLPGLAVPLPPEHSRHAFYRLYALAVPEELAAGWDRDRIVAAIRAEGVPCHYGTCAEVYREEAVSRAGLGPDGRLPGAARMHERQLGFFVHPTLSADDIDDVVAAVRKVMKEAAS